MEDTLVLVEQDSELVPSALLHFFRLVGDCVIVISLRLCCGPCVGILNSKPPSFCLCEYFARVPLGLGGGVGNLAAPSSAFPNETRTGDFCVGCKRLKETGKVLGDELFLRGEGGAELVFVARFNEAELGDTAPTPE